MQHVIAVDFDGTLCESRWPEIGAPNKQVIRELIRRQADGAAIILWTCRTGELLDEALLWCRNRGIRFDAVNENLPERIETYGTETRKISADEYWDDKSVPVVGGCLCMVRRDARGGLDVMTYGTPKKDGQRAPRGSLRARIKLRFGRIFWRL